MKRFLLAAALTAAFVTGAVAQTYDPSPRDPPFGKGNPGNDTYHRPSQADFWGSAGGSTTYGETWQGARVRRTPVTRTP